MDLINAKELLAEKKTQKEAVSLRMDEKRKIVENLESLRSQKIEVMEEFQRYKRGFFEFLENSPHLFKKNQAEEYLRYMNEDLERLREEVEAKKGKAGG